MTIVERIKQEITKKNTSIKAVEKELGIGNGTISKWDKQSPRTDKLIMVANYLQVSLDWLVFGKEAEALSEEEQKIIEGYRKASEGRKESVQALLGVTNLGKSSEWRTG